ncbi:hypothetical protein J4526_00940 [Desulfurococcaceae archaeon MEX13E-LK6-19]|nr:hypothetical protein J4526_00940 [Desulfurococcaceae archaeon MEX13E-LK6-19]
MFEIRFKKLQKPIDHGIVAGIINPCIKNDHIKPMIIIYADEHPIGEMLEVSVLVDKYIEFTSPYFLIIEADVYQAELLNPENVKELAEKLGIRRYFLSKWNIIDLYMVTQIIEKHSLDTFLSNILKTRASENPYVQGLINYLRRNPQGKDLLVKTETGCKLCSE